MEVGRIDPDRLVFVDEMGTHTSLAPLYAYAPVGERAFFEKHRLQSPPVIFEQLGGTEVPGDEHGVVGESRLRCSTHPP